MGIARTSAILSGALLAKGLLSPAYSASVRVTGLQDFLNVLYSAERQQGRGVVTVCNHISTMDDPTMWGVLPLRTFLSERTTRWTLGANNILFNKGPLLASFFRAGQCLDTIRGGPSNGGGVYQPAIDEAVNIVDGGGWVHLFGEGGICQSNTYVVNGEGDQAEASLRRFKWGIGRIIMDTERPPLVVPMWITGFDRLMPEGRSVPFKFLPKPRQHLSVNFGSPISSSRISKVLGATSKDLSSYTPLPWLNEARRRVVRSALAELVRGEVMALGKRVSGPMLGMPSKTQQGVIIDVNGRYSLISCCMSQEKAQGNPQAFGVLFVDDHCHIWKSNSDIKSLGRR